MRVAVGLSGGADSLLSLVLLQEAGHEVLGLHGLLTPHAEATQGLSALCERLGVRLHVVDLRPMFEREVMDHFANEYRAGRTPNPCVQCNERIKFGALLDAASKLGADELATGHYARLDPAYGAALRLCTAGDSAKDQSYFLARVPPEVWPRVHFPLARLSKPQVLAALAKRDLAPVHAGESMDICFVPGGDYRAHLHSRGVELSGPGPMVLPDGTRVGTHEGLWNYTEGQRRGLGIGYSEPLYVVDKQVHENRLVVGSRTALGQHDCTLHDMVWQVAPARWPDNVFVKLRYRQKAGPARWSAGDDDTTLRLTFEARRTVTPGQLGVVYDAAGVVLAGGYM